MIRFSFGAFRMIAHAALVLAAAFVTGCGSGAVSAPPVPAAPGPINITPNSATVYSDTPTTFIITGGNGNYIVTSSNQAALPIAGAFAGGNALTVTPNPVATDTAVTLTVGDTAGTSPATATLTVKPKTVSNVITIVPSASQPASCGSALCAGGDAEVRAALGVNGLALPQRQVRFDVISGDVRFIVSAPGLPEQLATSTTATTDSSGVARVRIRALTDAPAQTAIVQIVDVSSGSSQRGSVVVAPSSSAALNAQPATIVFQGKEAGTCASGISADVIVFGGRPPYLISQPGSFAISPTIITNSGGRFSVTATGQCTSGSQIAVVDAAGATVTVTASNKLSDLPVVPATQPLAVSPTSVTLTSCNDIANVALSGGSGTYVAASGNASVRAFVSGNVGSIQRASGPGTGQTTVTFSDGKTAVGVTVTLTGNAATASCS